MSYNFKEDPDWNYTRYPIAHTCAFIIEISTEYSNYVQFSTEMKVVLSDENSGSWTPYSKTCDSVTVTAQS